MFKRSLIAALLLLPAAGFAAGDTADPKGPSAAQLRKADANRDGKLSRAEVEKSLPRLSASFDSIDTDKDGQLSRRELSAWRKAQRGERQAKAAQRFRHADTDGDGAISRAEAEQHAPRLARRFDQIDANRDGKLTPEELRAYRESRRTLKDKG